MIINIEQLERPFHSGDWHDKPLKWAVNGPNGEKQCFVTQKDALRYRSIRRNTLTSNEAIRQFSRES